MAFNAPKSGGKFEWENCPDGNHMARIFRFVDLGTQRHEFPGQEVKYAPAFSCMLEVPSERTKDDKPCVLYKQAKYSLDSKAFLNKLYMAANGKELGQNEKKTFHPKQLLNKWVLVQVVGGYIKGVSSLPKGLPTPEPFNEVSLFEIPTKKADWDQERFEKLGKKTREAIQSSPEYKALFPDAPADQSEEHPPF